MRLSYDLIVPVIGLLLSLALSYVIFRHRSSILARKLLYLAISFGIWYVQLIGFYIAPDTRTVDIWAKIFLSGLIIIPFTASDLVLSFTKNRNRIILAVIGAISCTYILLNLTGRFGDGYVLYKNIKYILVGNIVFKSFVLYFVFIMVVLCPFLLIRSYRSTRKYSERIKYKYFFMAYIIGVLIGSTNFLSNLGLKIYPLGALAAIPFISIITYAIIKHELLDIKVVVRKTLLFTLLSLFVSGVYAAMLAIVYLLTRQYSSSHSVIAGFLAVIVISFLFQPVRDRIQDRLERLFHRRKADYNRLLQQMSSILSRFTDIYNLFTWIGNHLLISMQMEWIDMYLLNIRTNQYESVGRISGKHATSDSTGRHAYKNSDPLLCAILPGQTAAIRIEEMVPPPPEDGSMLIPLSFENDLLGFYLLGPKLSEQPYSPDDEGLLSAVASQTAATIRTINLFDEMDQVRHVMFEQDKMAALGTLAFGIAHEIKNPLTPIKTFTQKMISKVETDREKEMGQRVTAEFKRVEDMLNNLLSYGRSGTGKREETDLNKLLADTLGLFSADLRHGRIVRQEQYDGTLPPIRVEANRLVQVFLNLITNAMQAMPDGGTLTVTTVREENRAVIRFKDTGTGMTPEVLDKIFMPLYTSKPRGTGLGLAISTNIIKEYNGSLTASSIPGQGSEFTVDIPLFPT